MTILIDKLILLLFCIATMCLNNLGITSVFAFWSSIAFAALLYTVTNIRLVRILTFIYCILTLFVPSFVFFLPLILYDCLPDSGAIKRREYLFGADPSVVFPFLVPFYHFFRTSDIFHYAGPVSKYFLFFFLLMECICSLLLSRKTSEYLHQNENFRKMRDEDAELQLLLEERNKSLLEKQNTEIYTATLRERNRIAREIHDNVGHMLTRSILMVGALKTTCKEQPLSQPLELLQETLNQAMDSIRKSVHDLHDSSLNLEESLKNLIKEFTFCPVELQYDMPAELPSEMKYSVVAIVKEALVNISKHSEASKADISILAHPGFYQLIIRDNGKGSKKIEEGQPSFAHSSGIGLSNIRNRVQGLGGNLSIKCDHGFQIYIMLPR